MQLKLVNTLIGLVLAHSMLGDTAGGHGRHVGAEELRHEPGMVARSLGASRPQAFLLVTLPQIRLR